MPTKTAPKRSVSLREALLALPHWPLGPDDANRPDAQGYIDRAELVRDVEGVTSCFEFGGHYGWGLATWIHTFPGITRVGWCDNEGAFEGSNQACYENVLAATTGQLAVEWFTNAGQCVDRQYDLVMVDGDHGHGATLIDLALALAMRPKVIVVDDMQLGGPNQAVHDFANYTGLTFDLFPAAAGTARFLLEDN